MKDHKYLIHLCHSAGCLAVIGDKDWYCEKHLSMVSTNLRGRLLKLLGEVKHWMDLPGPAYNELLNEANAEIAFRSQKKRKL